MTCRITKKRERRCGDVDVDHVSRVDRRNHRRKVGEG
jgi:hypothetical protein